MLSFYPDPIQGRLKFPKVRQEQKHPLDNFLHRSFIIIWVWNNLIRFKPIFYYIWIIEYHLVKNYIYKTELEIDSQDNFDFYFVYSTHDFFDNTWIMKLDI